MIIFEQFVGKEITTPSIVFEHLHYTGCENKESVLLNHVLVLKLRSLVWEIDVISASCCVHSHL